MIGTFPFGQPASRRDPRRPRGRAELFVLGVYPSALHVRWRRPDGETIGALAIADEPEVFWDGADAADRIAAWRGASEWDDSFGSLSPASGNGSSGRSVVSEILTPLRVAAQDTYFTDCLPFYFTKNGPGSQGRRVSEVYAPFAAEHGLAQAVLPSRPSPAALVRRTLADESDVLGQQLAEGAADRVVTLGQEAADVLAALVKAEPVTLRADDAYGTARSVRIGRRTADWIPLTHPGNHHSSWRTRHTSWVEEAQA